MTNDTSDLNQYPWPEARTPLPHPRDDMQPPAQPAKRRQRPATWLIIGEVALALILILLLFFLTLHVVAPPVASVATATPAAGSPSSSPTATPIGTDPTTGAPIYGNATMIPTQAGNAPGAGSSATNTPQASATEPPATQPGQQAPTVTNAPQQPPVEVMIGQVNISVLCAPGQSTQITISNPSNTMAASWSATSVLYKLSPASGVIAPGQHQVMNVSGLIGPGVIIVTSAGKAQDITIACL